jgi:xanthine phosphoribosyltransferase
MIYPVSWKGVDDCCRELAESIRTMPPRSREIIAVSRGGICPAGILSYELDIPISDIIVSVSPPTLFSTRDDILIVDDICDTGRTFEILRRCFPNALFLTLYTKPEGMPLCDYTARFVTQDTWVVFPWALHDQVNR